MVRPPGAGCSISGAFGRMEILILGLAASALAVYSAWASWKVRVLELELEVTVGQMEIYHDAALAYAAEEEANTEDA